LTSQQIRNPPTGDLNDTKPQRRSSLRSPTTAETRTLNQQLRGKFDALLCNFDSLADVTIIG
jgi:hypothetical protein